MESAVFVPPPNGGGTEALRAQIEALEQGFREIKARDTTAAFREEQAALERAYEALRARDGKAEARARLWMLLACLMTVAVLGSVAWDHLDKREVVKPLVQQVQVTEEGKVINVGLPVPVLDYSPEDAQWYDMLGQWVQKVRSRSPGPDMTLARANWRWAYLHSCGAGMELLKSYEEQVKPFEPQRKTISVELLGNTKTLVPLTYHVYWRESISEPSKPIQHRTWNTVFTVGRVALTKESEINQNRMGLCVTGYSWSQEAGS